MTAVPLTDLLLVAGTLLVIGLAGLLARRNVLFMLIAIEVMLNATGLAFVAAGARWGQVDGQVMFIFVLTMAAAGALVGLALVRRLTQWGWRRLGDTEMARLRWYTASLAAGTVLFVALVLFL